MLGILAATALLGYFKGMVWQLAWIAGIVVSGFVSMRFANQFAPYFGQQEPWNRFASMLALYVGTSLAVWLLFQIVSGAINAIHLSAFDHQLGLLFGAAKGILLCVVITFFAVMLAPDYRSQVVTSHSGQIVATLLVRADEYLPKEIHETIDPFVKQFEEQFQQSGGQPVTRTASSGTTDVTDGTSPLTSIWNGISSAAAWAGAEKITPAEQGTPAKGGLPKGSSWFVPSSETPTAQPAGYQTPTARPESSSFSSPPSNTTPQQFPIGAQSPLKTPGT